MALVTGQELADVLDLSPDQRSKVLTGSDTRSRTDRVGQTE